MKYFLAGAVLCLVGLSVVAWWLTPDRGAEDRAPLLWTTDPNPQRKPQVEVFNEMYPDCFLKIDPDNSGLMKVIVQSWAGIGPDIIGHIGLWSYQTYHEANILWDITEKAEELGFGLDTLAPSVRDWVLVPEVSDEGRVVHRQYIYPCNVYHTILFYNKNIFDRYGVGYPSEDLTWEEYLEIGRRLTVFPDSESVVPSLFGAAGVHPMIVIWQKGGRCMNSDGTRCLLDSEEVIDGMTFYHDLFYSYGVEPTPTQKAGVSSQGGWGGGYINWFGEGRIAMLWGARWMLIQLRRFVHEQRQAREIWLAENPDRDPEEAPDVLRMGACLVPRFKGKRRATRYGARCVGINAASPNREAALKFLQYLTTEEYSKLINDGADSKPGNMAYNRIEFFRNPEFPGEEQIHRMSLKAVPDGRAVPKSMLIPMAVFNKRFFDAKENLDSSPDLTRNDIAEIMMDAARRVNLDIARNIKRDRQKRRAYEALLRGGAERVLLDLEEVK